GVPPVRDGPWPATDAATGEIFQLRGQRLVAVALHPFHYDERTGRLVVYRSMSVRVAFSGRAGTGGVPAGEDKYFEPLLKNAVLNYEQGRGFRIERGKAGSGRLLPPRTGARAPGARVQAFDEGMTEVRVRLDSTGVWALDFDQLAAAGFPAAVADTEVSVHRHEFLGNQVPPYATIEIPVTVDDRNGNGVFDSGDRIVLFVQDWAERSGASLAQRGWGDAEVVYVTFLPGRAGLRIANRDGTPSRTGLTPLASYPYTRRFEKNSADFFSFPPDTLTDLYDWTQFTPYYLRSDTLMFEASQVDVAQPASMTVEMQGRIYEYHLMAAAITNQSGLTTALFDSSTATWTGNFADTETVSIPASALSEGLTNHLLLWGKNQPIAPDPNSNGGTNVGLNWFDVSYWRRFAALRGYLDCNSAGVSGPYEILASTFASSTDARALDITDPLDPRWMSGAAIEPNGPNWNLRFQDVAGAELRRYVVLDTPKSPPADHYSAVTRRFLASHAPADYLLITPEAFLPAVQPLLDLRQSEGMNVMVAPLESVNDEFNGGRHADYSVRRFLEFAYAQWGARFVTLLGDGAAEDPQNFLGGSNPDWIPSHRLQGPVGVFSSGGNLQEIVPGDNWYVWCLDPAASCNISLGTATQDMFIGRLPVNSLAEAQGVVHKVVRYESVQPADLWRRRMVLLSDDDFSDNNTFGGGLTSGYCERPSELIFEQLSAGMRNVLVNQANLHQSEAELFNLGDWLAGEQVVAGCRPDRNTTIQHTRATVTPALFQRLNDGRLWWDYQGHANEQLLSHESFYVDNKQTIDDTQKFANDGKPFLFTAFSCHTNNFGRRYERGLYNFAPGPALGPDLVTLGSDRGAIASWASVGYEYVPSNSQSHLSLDLTDALFFDPPRDPALGEHGARVVLGEAVSLALLHGATAANPAERQVGETYTLLGDPATRLSIGSPQALVIANGDTVMSDVAVRLTTPGDTLRLDADIASNQQ
ncbi:MAG: C25 family cysteine peptidase, partial [Candidatus Eiseniibacteriota bacterium]